MLSGLLTLLSLSLFFLFGRSVDVKCETYIPSHLTLSQLDTGISNTLFARLTAELDISHVVVGSPTQHKSLAVDFLRSNCYLVFVS